MTKQQQATDRLEIWMNGNDEMRWAEVSIGQHQRWCVRLFEIQVDGKCLALSQGEGRTLEDALDAALDELPHAEPLIAKVRSIATRTAPLPGGFSLKASGREIVRITEDGNVVINPEFTLDDAARRFWEAVQQFAAVRD